jgi:acetylornithine deacetylase/succinyl-diaminopimelate desuccinylase-like protein
LIVSTITELASKLIAFRSLSYHEMGIAEYIADFFESRGITAELDRFNPADYLQDGKTYPDTANVYIPIGSGKHSLVLYAHTDVVNGSDKQFRPFLAWDEVYKSECLFGRGASDMKGSLAGLMVAALEMKESIEAGDRQVVFAFIADEETSGTGAHRHSERLARQGFNSENLWVILTEPTDAFAHAEVSGKGYIFMDVDAPLADLVPALQGLLKQRADWLSAYPAEEGFTPPFISVTRIWCEDQRTDGVEVVTYGKRGHISVPEKGENALEKMLEQLDQPVVGIRTGDNSPNQHPEICHAYLGHRYAETRAFAALDVRTTVGADKGDHLLDKITGFFKESGVSLHVRDRGAAYRSGNLDSGPFALCKASTQPEPVPSVARGGSDAGFYSTVTPHIVGGFGPGRLADIHTADERISVESLQRSVGVFSRLIRAYISSE